MPIPRKRACPIEVVMDLCTERWTLNIIFELMWGDKRFGELLAALDGISKKTLTQRLRKLEDMSIVDRRAFSEVPPRVEYSLTELGRDFRTVLEGMSLWGSKFVKYQMEHDGYIERPKEVFFEESAALPLP